MRSFAAPQEHERYPNAGRVRLHYVYNVTLNSLQIYFNKKIIWADYKIMRCKCFEQEPGSFQCKDFRGSQGCTTRSCVVELAGRKHVALLRFLTFSYSPLRLPVVHLRVLVSWYFIFIIAVAPHMKIPLDAILFYKMLKEKTKTKKAQTGFWMDQCGAKITRGENAGRTAELQGGSRSRT